MIQKKKPIVKKLVPPNAKRVGGIGETVPANMQSNQIGESLWRESVQVASRLPAVTGTKPSARAINETARDIVKWAQMNNLDNVRDPQILLLFSEVYLDHLDG